MTIRVLLADDQALLRATFRILIDSSEDMDVVAEAADGRDAVELTRTHRPDIVLMDIRMPGTDGLAATAEICADPALRGTRVLILTTFETDEHVARALRIGASGFLGKDVTAEELLDGIRTVAAGDALLSAAATRSLITRFLDSPDPGRPRAARGPGRPHRPRARGDRPGRGRQVRQGDRGRTVPQPADGTHPRPARQDQARRPGPRPTGRPRLPLRPRAAAPLTACSRPVV